VAGIKEAQEAVRLFSLNIDLPTKLYIETSCSDLLISDGRLFSTTLEYVENLSASPTMTVNQLERQDKVRQGIRDRVPVGCFTRKEILVSDLCRKLHFTRRELEEAIASLVSIGDLEHRQLGGIIHRCR